MSGYGGTSPFACIYCGCYACRCPEPDEEWIEVEMTEAEKLNGLMYEDN